MPDAVVGVINLDVEPERAEAQRHIPGFLRCDATFSFPVIREVAKGATIERVVAGDPALNPSFVSAAKALEARGAGAVVGDCGFIVSYQGVIAEAVSVPVVSSSLLVAPLIYRILPRGKRVGIVTAEKRSLAERHFKAAGWSSSEVPVAVKGLDEYPPDTWMPFDDHEKKQRNTVRLVRDLTGEHPDVGAILLECTHVQPYARAVQRDAGLPVFDITALIRFVHGSLDPPRYL